MATAARPVAPVSPVARTASAAHICECLLHAPCGLPRGTEALRQLKFWLGVESLARLAMKHNTSLSEHKRSNATARRAFLAFLAFLIHLIRIARDFVSRAISASAVCQQQRLALFCCQEQHTAAAGAAHRALSGRLLISQPSQPSNAARAERSRATSQQRGKSGRSKLVA